MHRDGGTISTNKSMAIQQVFLGKKLLPLSSRGKFNGKWENDPPPSGVMSDVEYDYDVKANHVYQSVTEFLGPRQVFSRATVQPADVVLNVVLTVGQADSPVNYDLYDITPDFTPPPPPAPTP